MNLQPAIFKHNGFRFVQKAAMKPRPCGIGWRAVYSNEYPPIFAFWNREDLTAKEIIKRVGNLKAVA